MLDEQVKELIKKFELKDEKAITFGHPKMKIKWILPLPGMMISSFDQFQPFFIYFDREGISFFSLNINNNYSVMGKSYVSCSCISATISLLTDSCFSDTGNINALSGARCGDATYIGLETSKVIFLTSGHIRS